MCLTFCCQHSWKGVAEEKYAKYEQNRWLKHCKMKALFHETKQFHIPSSTAALGKTLPCHPHFTLIIKHDFKDACERLDNLFIDTTTIKEKQTRAFFSDS